MLAGRTIVCIGKDWQESPTSNNHIMSSLAKTNTVIWINSTAMRMPSLMSSRDIKKIFLKIKERFRGPKKIGENFYIVTPLILPLPQYEAIRKLNGYFLKRMIERLVKALGSDSFDIWLFYPTAVDMIEGLKRDILVYYCTDEWSQFSYLDSDLMKRTEEKTLERADVVFAASRLLYSAKSRFNCNAHYMPHGVDYNLFSDGSMGKDALPEDIKTIRRPIIGFYGLIQDWIDFDLLRYIAEAHREWSLVLIGKVATDISSIRDVKNIHILGEKPYRLLPAYSACFDVAIIPYDMKDPRMKTVNPTKLKQYLASGLPVVSVDLPEVAEYNKWVSIAVGRDGFITSIENCLRNNSKELVKERKLAVREEDWRNKADEISDIILQTLTHGTAGPRNAQE